MVTSVKLLPFSRLSSLLGPLAGLPLDVDAVLPDCQLHSVGGHVTCVVTRGSFSNLELEISSNVGGPPFGRSDRRAFSCIGHLGVARLVEPGHRSRPWNPGVRLRAPEHLVRRSQQMRRQVKGAALPPTPGANTVIVAAALVADLVRRSPESPPHL